MFWYKWLLKRDVHHLLGPRSLTWEQYETNVQHRNILPEQNVELAYSHYDEFLRELERC